MGHRGSEEKGNFRREGSESSKFYSSRRKRGPSSSFSIDFGERRGPRTERKGNSSKKSIPGSVLCSGGVCDRVVGERPILRFKKKVGRAHGEENLKKGGKCLETSLL